MGMDAHFAIQNSGRLAKSGRLEINTGLGEEWLTQDGFRQVLNGIGGNVSR
jgi:hypothetical protein